jgi:hypothetical protein
MDIGLFESFRSDFTEVTDSALAHAIGSLAAIYTEENDRSQFHSSQSFNEISAKRRNISTFLSLLFLVLTFL